MTGPAPAPRKSRVGSSRRPLSRYNHENPHWRLANIVSTGKGGLVAVYPGSFDPITYGHLDLIQRGSKIAGRLVVAVLQNEEKQALFSPEERMDMLREVVHEFPNVEVDSFEGLLVDYAKRRDAQVLIRGIRAISDYEYELQMALMNRRLAPDIETLFMMSGEAYSFISSRLVKEVIGLGGNISGLVPPSVEVRLRDRFHVRQR